MLVKTVALLALSSLPITSATAADIVADLQDLTARWTVVSNALVAPVNSLATALAIHNDLNLVGTSTNTATTDVVNTGPFSETDGQTILPVFQNLCSTVVSTATNRLILAKPSFDALTLGGVPALLKQDLTTINGATDGLAVNLVANAPTSQKSDFQTAASGCERVVQACLAVYNS